MNPVSKNYKLRIVAAAVLTLIATNAFAQSGNKYKNYNYQWPSATVAPIAVDERFKNEDAVILSQDVVLRLERNYFKINKRIKFLTQNGVDKFSTMVLPQSFDPAADKGELNYAERDTTYRPRGEFNSVLYFAARRIKADGTTEPLKYEEKVQHERKRVKQIDRDFFTWLLKVNGLKPGDEIEVEYAYEKVYAPFVPCRIYFSEELPKQQCTYHLKYLQTYLYFYNAFNNAPLADTVDLNNESPKLRDLQFKLTNVPACNFDKGIRTTFDLPYISFYEHFKDFGDDAYFNSSNGHALPYPWEYIYKGFINYNPDDRNYLLTRNDDKTVACNNLYKAIALTVTDTSSFAKFNAFHTMVVDSFGFDRDIAWLEGDNQNLPHLERDIANKVLRYSNSKSLYNEMGFRLNAPFYLGIPSDNRFERFMFNVFYPQASANLFFVVPDSQSYYFFYPKTSRFGYEMNEFPFYYEGNKIILIPQTLNKLETFEAWSTIKYPHVVIPKNNEADNTRLHAAMINVITDSMKINFDSRLALNGQFSTITRGYYEYGAIDTTVNTRYYKTVYAISKGSKLISKEQTSHASTYPFTTNFRIKYTAGDLLSKTEGGFSIPFKNWFNAVYDDLKTGQRTYPYRPDFLFSDQLKYMIHFDTPVEISNRSDFNFSIENSFAHLNVSLSALQDDTYSFNLTYQVIAEKTEPANFKDVIEIFDALKQLDALKINFRKK